MEFFYTANCSRRRRFVLIEKLARFCNDLAPYEVLARSSRFLVKING